MTTAYASDASFTEHDFPRHPEHAGRIKAVWAELASSGLDEQMLRVAALPATDQQIRAVHSAAHLQGLRAISQQPKRVFIDPDTYALPASLGIARRAAGAVIQVIDAIAGGKAVNGMAVVRPPGHHATASHPMGFCLLNSIAIAARHAQKQQQLEKVLILDYDVHHGNGTQDIFYADPSVLFISIHQSPFYPGSGGIDEIGAGAGRGSTLNIPIPGGCGDDAYALLFAELVQPAIAAFEPDLMLVSAGFDAHWADPLAQMQLSLAGYDALARASIQMAQAVCDGRIVFVMEGGYDLPALAHGWRNIAGALLGSDELSDPYGAAPQPRPAGELRPLIRRLRRLHAR